VNNLAAPSKELAVRILQETGFDDRFVAYRMRERNGYLRETLYSFTEAVELLKDPTPYLDLPLFVAWIRGVMGDEELAEKITEVITTEASDQGKTMCVRDLVAMRLQQSKETIQV